MTEETLDLELIELGAVSDETRGPEGIPFEVDDNER